MNRKTFFDGVRHSLFGGKLKHGQVVGMDAMLNEFDRRVMSDLRHLAYMMATTFHETAFTMEPINEIGSDAYFMKMYDKTGARPKVAAKLGNTKVGDGALYHGRGFVQLTGRGNYARMGTLLKIPLVDDPDAALRPAVATAIMFEGMLRAESFRGDFTGKSLEDYFNAKTEDWVNARRIINALDKAETIAGYGKKFYAALRAAS